MSDNDTDIDEMDDEPEINSISVGRDYETSERAGMSGAFQISSVSNDDSGEDLSDQVDQGMHFNDTSECDSYLRDIFGKDVNIDYADEVS